MDKNILKKFAIESRQELMEKIKNKINTFYVEEEFSKEQKGDLYILSNEKHSLSLTNEEYKKRELLIKRIKELSLEQVIEEAAYTWFNRIIAIRYMEIHDYLPLTKNNQSLGIRVLSSKDNTPDPEIMKFTNLVNPELDIELNKEKYANIKDNNERFKYVLLLVCRKLGKVIPQVFGGVTDYIDILIPDNLLNDTGFITKVIKEVSEENYNQVEIIGWLYQYYNQTEKDRVISAKKQYKKNEIAYATQLFTTDWVVRYMVENSLVRYWIEHNNIRDMEDNELIKKCRYLIKENFDYKDEVITAKDITFIDPCCGSGHILIYAFELLYQIYLYEGYRKNDIPKLIIQNNIYGLDIDDRAGQLAVLSVVLKAREYDKNIFDKELIKNLNVMSVKDSKNINVSVLDSIRDEENKETAEYLLENFKDAKEIGTLLLLEKRNYDKLEEELKELNDIFAMETKQALMPLIKLAKLLVKVYSSVVTNPPYMNGSVMPTTLKDYVIKYYNDYKADLFAAFMIRNMKFGEKDSYLSFMTPFVWMFIASYQKLREYIINNKNIFSLIQMEYSAFEEATVPICSFILKNQKEDKPGYYYRLSNFTGGMEIQKQKVLEAQENKDCGYFYKAYANNFSKIPGSPIAFWISESLLDSFANGTRVEKIAYPRQGMATTNNNKFLRQWFEVNIDNIGFNLKSEEETIGDRKWFPYNKGGEYRKWYGNNDYVVNFKNKGEEICNYIDQNSAVNHTGRVINRDKYFNKSVTWSKISSGNIAFRFKDNGFIFDVAGTSIFGNDDTLLKLIGFLNSNVSLEVLNCLSPTLNYEVGHICSIPILDFNDDNVEKIVLENINISKEDWDSFEISWDFEVHPLVKNKVGSLKEAFDIWNNECEERFNTLKANEEELNRIFIDIYGLNDELTPEVDEKDITIRKEDKVRDIKSLISYAVGCMFGRYSLDEEGLVYAGGEFDENRYKTFKVDSDNIIPITDEAYFGDDIVERFKTFIEVVYGKETLYENLDYIAETLGKKNGENSEETIRRYFVNDFFKDHVKMYQKRPIYWLLDSGKKNGFKALVYMHRYDENLIPKARLDYVHKVQTTYEKLLDDVNYKLTTDLSMVEKKEMQKKQVDLNNKLNELKEYDEKIAHIANQRISIDLDDGVKVNYEKFEDILAKIK